LKKINLRFLFPLTALTILLFTLSEQMFDISPIGKLLDPFVGSVQNEDESSLNTSLFIIGKMGLTDSVHVFFDNRKVPHIYAKNTGDLYFAQGYVTASLRLWQMDFMSYAAAGRLSEIFSKREFLEYDRAQRRQGILDAARKTLKLIEKDPESYKALTAYSSGVNAYIKELNYKKMPLEYKLLDYEPEPWSNLKSVLILKSMASTLTGFEEDLGMSKMILALGENDFNKLYPDFYGHSTPVANNFGQPAAINYSPLKKPDYLNYSFLSSSPILSKNSYNPRLGSNSWAVSGKKTKSGFPILATDPHLNLSLPSIWIEMQLSAPSLNVYGVSIPGTPAIIIGFNENIAWGITNGADDVKDWYKLKITNTYKKYEMDGQWLDLKFRIEEIKRRGQPPFYDTIYSTIQGPIVYNKSFPGQDPDMMDNALRWELHNPSDEFLSFIKLNKARNYKDYKEALRHYSCPLQNFTFACKDNTIAMDHQGSMAFKWPGEGKFILDGTRSSHSYTKYIPEDSLPRVLNPACNYVLSANQHPTYPGYPYYYNGYYTEIRANRIKQLLESGNDFDISKMQAIQLDNTNAIATEAMPVLLKKTDTGALGTEQKNVLAFLRSWKGTYNFDDERARVYELWWKNIRNYTWDEFKNYRFYLRAPDDYILLDMIQNDPSNNYFDRLGSSKKENAGDIITEAFMAASDDFSKLKREGSTKWGDYNKINIMHLTNIPAFSKMRLSSAGHPDAINALSANWGPSWRMIVELGDRPKAFGIYPGGQSGNVGSRYYDDSVDDWNKGKYYPLDFYMSMEEAKEHATCTWTLKK